MRGAVLSPAAVDGQEHLRQLRHERSLLLRREHQVPVALLFVRQRGKNPSSDAKVNCTHMRALFRAFHPERNSPKILGIHAHLPCWRFPHASTRTL